MHPADDKPKHKPNPKHTLEEILKSLQDLIRNDLLEGDAAPPTASRAAVPTAATAPIGPRRAPQRDVPVPAPSTSSASRGPQAMDGLVADSLTGAKRGPQAMDGLVADSLTGAKRGPQAMDGLVADSPGGELAALRRSLESLVSEDLTTEDAGAAAPSASDGSAPSGPEPDAATPPEGLQDVFSFDSAAQAVAPEHAPSATPPDQDDRQPEPVDLARVTDGTETESSVAPQEQEAAAAQPAFDDSATMDSEALLATGSAPTAEDLPEFIPQAEVPPSGVAVEAPGGEAVGAADRLAAELPPDTSPPETAGDWDDIPVLDEVVTETVAEHEPGEPPDSALVSLPAGHPAEAEGPETGRPRAKTRVDSIDEPASQTPPDNLDLPLPAPSRAHDLAVRTVAKLNIELRKAGKRPLDAKVIARLAMLLRETLESDAAKVENKPHE